MAVTRANCISLVLDADPSFNLYSVGSTTKLSNSTAHQTLFQKCLIIFFYYFSVLLSFALAKHYRYGFIFCSSHQHPPILLPLEHNNKLSSFYFLISTRQHSNDDSKKSKQSFAVCFSIFFILPCCFSIPYFHSMNLLSHQKSQND